MATVRDVLRKGPATSEEIALELGSTVRRVSGCLYHLVNKGAAIAGGRVEPRDRRIGRWCLLYSLVDPGAPLRGRGEARPPAEKSLLAIANSD